MEVELHRKRKSDSKRSIPKKKAKSELKIQYPEKNMELDTHVMFTTVLEQVLLNFDAVPQTKMTDDKPLTSDDLLNEATLYELSKQLSSMKSSNCQTISQLELETLRKFLKILAINICNGYSPSYATYQCNNIDEIWQNTTNQSLINSAEACWICLSIMTCPNMPKRIYIEEIIDAIVIFIEHIVKIVLNRISEAVRKSKSNRKSGENSDSNKLVAVLYSKVPDLIGHLYELMKIQLLSKFTVSHILSVALFSFFGDKFENLKSQAVKIAVLSVIQYGAFRTVFFEQILDFICRITHEKKSQFNNGFTFILDLIQLCVNLSEKNDLKKIQQGILNADLILCKAYERTVTIASHFLSILITKCQNEKDEIVFKLFLEKFVQYLLTVLNKPEWPIAEMLLSFMGKIFLKHFSKRDAAISWRISCLDFITILAVKLRKDSISLISNTEYLDTVLKNFGFNIDDNEAKTNNSNENYIKTKLSYTILLEFFGNNKQNKSLPSAQLFCTIQRYYCVKTKLDALVNKSKETKVAKCDKRSKQNRKNSKNSKLQGNETALLLEEEKRCLLLKIIHLQEDTTTQNNSPTSRESAEMSMQYLALERQFYQSFDQYLEAVLSGLEADTIAIRTKAMKCVVLIAEADTSLLLRDDVQLTVNNAFFDQSASVRETALELVGKSILAQSDLLYDYYDTLLKQVSDPSVAVRKKVINIFKDICLNYPKMNIVPVMYFQILQRINDEESIKKLVIGIFKQLWFAPDIEVAMSEKSALIVNVVKLLIPNQFNYFELLLQHVLDAREAQNNSSKKDCIKSVVLLSEELVDYLVDDVMEEQRKDNHKKAKAIEVQLTIVNAFAKITPQCLVKHASKLQTLIKSEVNPQIMCLALKALNLVIPCLDQDWQDFLFQSEKDLVTLIMQQGRKEVIADSMSCLSLIVNSVTKNFKLIHLLFTRLFSHLENYRKCSITDDSKEVDINKCYSKMAIFSVGLLVYNFDLQDIDGFSDLPANVIDEVYDLIIYFLQTDDLNVKLSSLKAIGFICSKYHKFMLDNHLKECYCDILTTDASSNLKIEVLTNIKNFLLEEDHKLASKEKKWVENSKNENLKQMFDIESGMASTVIQLYMKEVLQSYLHQYIEVRRQAYKVVAMILRQGLVNPLKIVPYLMCMGTDTSEQIVIGANRELSQLDIKYPGFISSNISSGLHLSYNLQKLIREIGVIRGFYIGEEKQRVALNDCLYRISKGKQQKRGIIKNILKCFDEKSHDSLSYRLYLADNLAYFPYAVQDEVLFVMYHIDIIVSVAGTNFLQIFCDGLMVDRQRTDIPAVENNTTNFISTMDEDENEEDLVARVPDDTTELQKCMTAAQGCLLLLTLKQYLKSAYRISDLMLQNYSPFGPAKLYDNPIRKRKLSFEPKSAIDKLKEGSSSEQLNERDRRRMVKSYLEFKKLMVQFDKEVDDD